MDVVLNSFQHLLTINQRQTLKQVQGDSSINNAAWQRLV
jgi:hypothetical protein